MQQLEQTLEEGDMVLGQLPQKVLHVLQWGRIWIDERAELIERCEGDETKGAGAEVPLTMMNLEKSSGTMSGRRSSRRYALSSMAIR